MICRTAILLPVLSMLASLPAADRAEAQAQAQVLLAQERWQEAIPHLVASIEADRSDVESSAPALIDLVRCYQKMHMDPACAAQYASTMGKYLTRPPALDGQSLPELATVEEDLLWKSWVGEGDRVQLRLGQARVVKLISKGKNNPTLYIDIELHVEGLLRLSSDLDPRRVAQPQVRITDSSGAELPLKHVGYGRCDSGDRVGQITVAINPLPAGKKLLSTVQGAIVIEQIRRAAQTMIDLRKGASWNEGARIGTLDRCDINNNIYDIMFVIKPKGHKDGLQTNILDKNMTGFGNGMLQVGGKSLGEVASRPATSWLPFALLSAEGVPYAPCSSRGLEDGGADKGVVRFSGVPAPAMLQRTTVASSSSRTLNFAFKDVAWR